MGTLAISAANLDTLEHNMLALNNNINAVTSDIININGQITNVNQDVLDMKKEMKSLEQEIRDFMADIRGTTLVSNAQNDILIKENELNRKYANYDTIRRQTSGLLEGININLVRKNTLATETEKVLFKAPTYYLSYALIAISSWFNNDKDKANAALNEALKINPKKTSLLLCLVHMRLKRTNTAIKWLKKYMGLQNPLELDNDFVVLIEALTVLNIDSIFIETIKPYLEKYAKEVRNNKDIVDRVSSRWVNFFSGKKVEFKEIEYPNIAKFTDNWNGIKETLGNAYSYNGVYEDLVALVENTKVDKDKNIDKLIYSCINNYEDEELNLRKQILKDKLIINNNGNINKAQQEYIHSGLAYNVKVDYYTLLNNILFERNDVSTNTKRFALSALRNIIKDTLEDTLPSDRVYNNIKISINEWEGNTLIGDNENDLKGSLHKYVESLYKESYNKTTYFNMKIILSVIVAIIGAVVTIGVHFLIGLAVMIIALVNLYFFCNEVMKTREDIIKEQAVVERKHDIVLENVLAEIVDVYFTSKRAKENYDYIMEYIDEYNEQNYIKRGV